MAKAKYDLYIEHEIGANDDSSLVLVNFPAMRSQFENPADLIKLSIKPKSLKLKMDVALDSGAPGFCHEKAMILAGKSVPRTFPDGRVNKNSYSSTKTTLTDGQLFVAQIVNDRIVCRPAAQLMTMRSDLNHFDLRDEIDPKEEVKPISVKFAAPERQHNLAAAAKDRQQQEAEDPQDEYREIAYKTATSREAAQQRAKLFGVRLPKVKPDPDAQPMDVKPQIVFEPDVKPKVERMDVDEDIYSNESQVKIETSPKRSVLVKKLVKECLLRAKLVSFEEIYQFVKSQRSFPENQSLNNKDILDALTESALLVQGNWAVKSEVLYGDSSERDCTDVTGISINLFIAARDYLLWLFTQDRLVSRLEYCRCVKMPDHDVRELFTQLAKFKADTKRWELKLPTDERFLTQFPDIVQRQATFWKVRRANKLSIFKAPG